MTALSPRPLGRTSQSPPASPPRHTPIQGLSVLLSKQTQNVVTFTATHQSESTLGSCLEKPEYLCPGFASSLSLGRGQQSEWPFSAVDQMPSFLSPKPSNAPPSASTSTWNESLSASYRAQEAWAAGSVPAGSVPLLSLPASMRVQDHIRHALLVATTPPGSLSHLPTLFERPALITVFKTAVCMSCDSAHHLLTHRFTERGPRPATPAAPASLFKIQILGHHVSWKPAGGASRLFSRAFLRVTLMLANT